MVDRAMMTLIARMHRAIKGEDDGEENDIAQEKEKKKKTMEERERDSVQIVKWEMKLFACSLSLPLYSSSSLSSRLRNARHVERTNLTSFGTIC